MKKKVTKNATKTSQSTGKNVGFLSSLIEDPVAGALSAFVFIVNLAPIVVAAFKFDAIVFVVMVIFCVPVIAFIIFLAFSYRYTRYSSGTTGVRILRSLSCTLGLTIVSLLVGVVVCVIIHGYNLKSCIDSCTNYTATEGAIWYLTFAQTYLAGAYLGTIIGATKSKNGRTS